MQVDTFDLSVDRSTRPQVSNVAPQWSSGVAQILRADGPAQVYIDGDGGEAIPAVPGLIIDRFTQLFVGNSPTQGKLVIGFYKCLPGSTPTPGLQHTIRLATGNGSNVTAQSDATPPNESWRVVVTDLIVYYMGTLANNAVIDFHEVSPLGAIGTAHRRGALLTSDVSPNVRWTFAKPLILEPGHTARLRAFAGGVGVTGVANIYGQIIR